MLITKEKTTQRMPRIQGLTYLSMNYQRERTDTSKEELYRYITTQYTLQGFRLNKISLTLQQFSYYTQIPLPKVMEYINTMALNMNVIQDPESIKGLMSSLITLSTTWAIQDKGMIMNQIEILAKAQGNKYKPFISGELNKAMKLSLESNKNIMEAYKSFFNSNQSTTNILNIIPPQKQENKEEYLTPDKALQLLRDNEQLALSSGTSSPNISLSNNNGINKDNEELAEKLFQEHSLVDFGAHNFGDSNSEPQSHKANIHAASELPGHKAKELKKRSSHEAFEARRGHEIEDTDTLSQ